MSEQRFKDKADALKRAEQHCKWMFDVVYYTCTTIIGYLIIRKTDFLPNYLGGSGSCSNIYVGHPKVQDIKFLNLYYQIQAGSHLYTFINQIWCKRNDTKFYEYALHHGLALFLIWFSYMMNLTQVGILVLILHDPADVFLILARAYTDYKFRKKYVNIAIYTICYLTWVYTRVVSFQVCCIWESILLAIKHKNEIIFHTF